MSHISITFDLRFLTIFSGLVCELGSRRSVMDPTKDFPKHQRNLIEDFLCACNTIDKNLRQRLNVDRKLSFVQMVKDFSREHPAWLNVDLLETAAEVRNFIVHGQRNALRTSGCAGARFGRPNENRLPEAYRSREGRTQVSKASRKRHAERLTGPSAAPHCRMRLFPVSHL
jgi:hypothetical protein